MNKAIALTKLFAVLCKNPSNPKVFWAIMRLASGKGREKSIKRFEESEIGKKVLKENLSLLSTMKNLDTSKEGSVAEYYDIFCKYWNIDRLAIEKEFQLDGRKPRNTKEVLFQRQLAYHELIHVILGYEPTFKGEMQVVMFHFGQSHNWGFVLIAMAIAWRYISSPYLMWKAYKRGKNTTPFDLLDWETLLNMNINEVKRMFA